MHQRQARVSPVDGHGKSPVRGGSALPIEDDSLWLGPVGIERPRSRRLYVASHFGDTGTLAQQTDAACSQAGFMIRGKWIIISILVVTGISTGTCGPGHDDSAEAQCRDLAKVGAQAADALCPCLVADGTFPDQQSCAAAFTSEDSFYDCACPIYGQYPESKAYFDCAAPVQKMLLDCEESSGCDPAKLDACLDSYLPAIMDCNPPEAAEDEVTAKCGTPAATTGDEPTGGSPTDGTTTNDTGDTGGAEPLMVDEMGCVLGCVVDRDRTTAIVDPNCEIIETNSEGGVLVIPRCLEINGSWEPSGGAQVCYGPLIDKTGKETLAKIDNMSEVCVDLGYNLELQIMLPVPPQPGSTVSANCQLSTNEALDCPNL